MGSSIIEPHSGRVGCGLDRRKVVLVVAGRGRAGRIGAGRIGAEKGAAPVLCRPEPPPL